MISLVVQIIFGKELVAESQTEINFAKYSLPYTCILMFFVMLPVITKKDFSIFIKINSVGALFVVIILTFIVGNGIYSMSISEFTFDTLQPIEVLVPPANTIYLVRTGFSSLAGMLCLGYYLHNVCIPIIKNNKE